MSFLLNAGWTWSDGEVVTATKLNSVPTLFDNQSYGFSLGAVGTPSMYFSGDSDTGIWSPSANVLALSVGGSEVFRINSSGLGIGTTPAAKLHVVGTGSYGTGIRLNNGGAHNWEILHDTAEGLTFGYDTTDIFFLSRSGSSQLTSGNFGIGVTPTTKLDVNGSARIRGLTTAGLVATDASGNLTTATHFVPTGTAPSIAANTGAGTSPTVAVTGTDTSGTITITVGTSPAGFFASVVTVTFNAAFAAAPRISLTPASPVAGSDISRVYASSSTTNFAVTLSTTSALTAGGNYIWYYHAIA